mgnify:CR=1 FL=1
MNFFKKNKIEGLPTEKEPNLYEKSQENLSVIRSIKKEKGYDTNVSDLNEKINSGENIGSYEEDELSKKLSGLDLEYWELANRSDVRRYKKEKDNYDKTKDRINQLKSEIEDSLDSTDREDNNYGDKIQNLRGQEGIFEYQKERSSMFTDETMQAINRMQEISEEWKKVDKELKEKYGNQDIKSEDGNYLN